MTQASSEPKKNKAFETSALDGSPLMSWQREGKTMYYRVTARLKPETAEDYQRKLTDGTIQSQRPDGREIVDSMNRAVLTDDGRALFSIACHCQTPLAHERATVFDEHFDAMQIEQIEGYQTYEGRPFMAYLAEIAERKPAR